MLSLGVVLGLERRLSALSSLFENYVAGKQRLEAASIDGT
jgi:hypothetical protein